jgi:phage terminase small subunit
MGGIDNNSQKGGETMTPKQKRFIECYQGNATTAAQQAGYSEKTAYAIGQKLLKNAEIQKAIQEREQERLSVVIASREERQSFWSETMRNPEEKMSDRIRASELLGKSEGDFLERVAAQVETLQAPIIEVHFIGEDELDEEGRFKDKSRYNEE